MKITIIGTPTLPDLLDPINLFNEVFQKFEKGPDKYLYDVSSTNKKIHNRKDTTLFKVNNGSRLIAAAIGYERYSSYFHIWRIAVKKVFRGQGIGSQIYEEIEKFAKKKGYKGVTINTNNRYRLNLELLIKRGYEIYDVNNRGKYVNDPKIMLKLGFN